MIKAFVINLAKNDLKYNSFSERFYQKFPDSSKIQLIRFDAIDGMQIDHKHLLELGYDTYRSWRDPHFNRKFTHGEIGCILSHIGVWKKCIELDEPILVFEDDIEFSPNLDLNQIIDILKREEFVYLSRKENGKFKKIDNILAIPSYSYWTCAYAIAPSAAKKLYDSFLFKNLLPADEYVPLILGIHPSEKLNEDFNKLQKIKPLAFEPNVCRPIKAAFDNSDTEIGYGTKYFKDFDLKIVTVATDLERARKLLSSAEKFNLKIKILGVGEKWTGGDIKNGPGGGIKINLLRKEIQTYKDDDVVLFVDGYDVLINDFEEEIIKRYLSFHSKVVFAAEKVCWPNRSLENLFEKPKKGYRYLNSGCFIGVVSELKRIISESLKDIDDDQLYFQKKILSKKYDAKLDHLGYIFQCISMVEDKIKINEKQQILNSETDSTGVILHGNGGLSAKQKFNSIYNHLFESNMNNSNTLQYKTTPQHMEVPQYMFGVPFYKTKIDSKSYDKDKIVNLIKENYDLDPHRNSKNWLTDFHQGFGPENNQSFKKFDNKTQIPILKLYKKTIQNFFNSYISKEAKFQFHIVSYTCMLKNQHMFEHIHYADFSAVHYIKYNKSVHKPTNYINPNSWGYHADALFTKKWTEACDVKDLNFSWMSTSFTLDVEEDDFVITPGVLRHFVPPSDSDELRMTLVLNIKFI